MLLCAVDDVVVVDIYRIRFGSLLSMRPPFVPSAKRSRVISGFMYVHSFDKSPNSERAKSHSGATDHVSSSAAKAATGHHS